MLGHLASMRDSLRTSCNDKSLLRSERDATCWLVCCHLQDDNPPWYSSECHEASSEHQSWVVYSQYRHQLLHEYSSRSVSVNCASSSQFCDWLPSSRAIASPWIVRCMAIQSVPWLRLHRVEQSDCQWSDWWGWCESSKGDVRRFLHNYPTCISKKLPPRCNLFHDCNSRTTQHVVDRLDIGNQVDLHHSVVQLSSSCLQSRLWLVFCHLSLLR